MSENKKEKFIKVIKVPPGEPPVIVELENELKSLQEAVSEGTIYRLIQLVGLEEGVDLLCNDEGKLAEFTPNRRLGTDIVCGTFYIVGSDDESGELVSLPPDKISKYIEMFKEPDVIDPSEVKIIMQMFFF